MILSDGDIFSPVINAVHLFESKQRPFIPKSRRDLNCALISILGGDVNCL